MGLPSAYKTFLKAALFFIPPLYLSLIYWLQPVDHLGDSEKAPWLGRWIYDDYDEAAYAQRGLNVLRGRRPGRSVKPLWFETYESFAEAREGGIRPDIAQEPYFLEYPHAMLPYFWLGYFLSPEVKTLPIASVLLEVEHILLVPYAPQNEVEQTMWWHLRRAIRIYQALAVATLLLLMFVLAKGYQPSAGLEGPLVLLILPASLYFSANRFDVLPALFTGLALACLGRRRCFTSALFLGLATMIKIYPVLLAPLFFRYLWRTRKEAARWFVGYAAVVSAFIAIPLYFYGWDGTLGPYLFQLGRRLEGGWTFIGTVLPPVIGGNELYWRLFRNALVLLSVLGLCWRSPKDLESLLRRGAIVLIVFVTFQVFFSPQWTLWLSPFLIPLAKKDRPVFWLTVCLDVLTYLSFPVVFDMPHTVYIYYLIPLLVWMRFLLLASLAVLLGWREWKGSPPFHNSATSPSFHLS